MNHAIIPIVTLSDSGRFLFKDAEEIQHLLGLKRPVLSSNRSADSVTTSADSTGRFAFRGEDSEMVYDGWVYLAKSDTGHYKIGRSKNPFVRIKHFDTIMPVGVEIAALIPCDDYVQAEKDLHGMFSEMRVNGEWFKLEETHIDFLQAILYYIDRRFVYAMNFGPGKENYNDLPCNSCCVDYRDDLIEREMLLFPPEMFTS